MGFLSGVLGGGEARAKAGGSFHVSQTPPGWVDSLSGWETATGLRINPDNSLEIGAVYACVRVLSESVAQLPLLLYRSRADGSRERARTHRLYQLLRYQPNPEMTAFEFREALMGHLLTWGNAYAEIEFDGAGRVLALWPLRPDRMRVERGEGGGLRYIYRLSRPDADTGDLEKSLAAWRVFHLRGLSSDGIIGYSPVRLQRLGISLARATEEFGGRFFGNDARPGGVLEHPGHLSDDAHERLRKSWETRHQGLSRSHRLAILEEGMKFHEIGLPPEDAQFLGTRKYQRSEIAGWFRVPPHMIGDLERATFSNIEHQGIEFVTASLAPWLVRWEQRIWAQLLSSRERAEGYFAEHLVDSLLRGDIQSRYAAYAQGRQNGWLSANDIRRLENMDPIPGGDVYLVPLNMIPAGQAGALGSLEGRGEGNPGHFRGNIPPAGETRSIPAAAWAAARSRHRLMLAHRGVYADALGRVFRREANDIGNAARRFFKQRDMPSFWVWLADFYREHTGFIIQQLRPVAEGYGALVDAETRRELGLDEGEGLSENLIRFIQSYLTAYASRHVIRNEEQLRAALLRAIEEGRAEMEALNEVFDDWRRNKPGQVGDEESVRFGNAMAKAGYGLAGVLALRWVSMGDSCPYCAALNGMVIDIQHDFLAAGEDFQPDGAERPLNPNRNVGHPPAHAGCDCMVVAG
ncbi:MAG TPA: phage portal protein [Anaerolineae bacterium]|nr:phage portal protein [Anaerolineae bacterium]